MKHSTIFRSRWWALIWAAGIIWFALGIAGAGDPGSEAATDATGAPIDSAQVNQLGGAIDGL